MMRRAAPRSTERKSFRVHDALHRATTRPRAGGGSPRRRTARGGSSRLAGCRRARRARCRALPAAIREIRSASTIPPRCRRRTTTVAEPVRACNRSSSVLDSHGGGSLPCSRTRSARSSIVSVSSCGARPAPSPHSGANGSSSNRSSSARARGWATHPLDRLAGERRLLDDDVVAGEQRADPRVPGPLDANRGRRVGADERAEQRRVRLDEAHARPRRRASTAIARRATSPRVAASIAPPARPPGRRCPRPGRAPAGRRGRGAGTALRSRSARHRCTEPVMPSARRRRGGQVAGAFQRRAAGEGNIAP